MFESRIEAAAYLSGILDADGSVILAKNAKSGKLVIYNTDPGVLTAVEQALMLLGVEAARKEKTKIGKLGSKQPFTITVGKRADIERLGGVLRLRCSYKRERLEALLALYKSSPRLPRALWPTDTVRKLVDDRGMSRRDVAAQFGVSVATIDRWMAT